MTTSNAASKIDEASHWLIQLESGTADLRAFEAWCNQDLGNAIAFAEVSQRWQQLDALARSDKPMDEESEERVREPLTRRLVLRAAFAVLGAGIAGTFASKSFARVSVETTIGEQRVLQIGEGVRLELNTQSRLKYRLSSDVLRLWLEQGEIRIEIGNSAPLVRLISHSATTSLSKGQYNVRERGTALDLMVLTGQADSGEDAAKGRVLAGQTALVGSAAIQVRQSEPIALERAQAWRQGELVFAGESLDFVLGEYNRYLANKIIVSDASLSRLRLGGRFTSQDPSEFLSALDASFGVVASKQSNGSIILVKRP